MHAVEAREHSFVAHHVELAKEHRDRGALARRLLPILQWLPTYSWRETLLADCAGGVTIGCVLMAQSVAHAQLSGVDLIHGPYSCLVPPLVYMFLGTSRQGSVGTGGLVALLTGTEMARYATQEERTQAATVLAFLVGVVLVAMGALRLSGIVRFMSRPALSGFVTGSALLIVESQLPGAMGFHGSKLRLLLDEIVTGKKSLHMPTVVLSVCILVALFGMQRLKKKVPRAKMLAEFKEIFVMAVSTTFCALYGKRLGINMVGAMPTGLPTATMPPLSHHLVQELLPGAVLLSMVIFISSYAAAKKVAMLESQQIDPASELLALGSANALGALFGAVPVQIGLSRTGIAYASGAKSQLSAGFITPCVIAVSLLFLTPLFYFMPRCTLNCVIIAAAKSLVDFDEPLWLYSLPVNWRDNKDLCVWVTALVVTLCWGAFQGMSCATALSLLLLVVEVTEPDLSVLACEDEKWQSSHDLAGRDDTGTLVARVDGILFYANIERFQEQIESVEAVRKRRTGEDTMFVILDFSCVPFVDSTVVEVLRDMVQVWNKRGTKVRVANAVGRTRKVLEKELGEKLGQTNFRLSVHEAHTELQHFRRGNTYFAPSMPSTRL